MNSPGDSAVLVQQTFQNKSFLIQPITNDEFTTNDLSTKGRSIKRRQNAIATISSTGRRNTFALSEAGKLYKMYRKDAVMRWAEVDTQGLLFRDIYAVENGLLTSTLFAVGKQDMQLYRYSSRKNVMELISPDLTTKIKTISAKTPKKVFAINHDGHLMYANFLKHNTKWSQYQDIEMSSVKIGPKYLGKREIWALGPDGTVFRLTHKSLVTLQFKFIDMCVCYRHDVFGLDLAGRLWKWNGSSGFNMCSGDAAQLSLLKVSPYRNNRLFGIDNYTGKVIMLEFAGDFIKVVKQVQ
ncbi:acyl-CoA synthetase family member [Acrasis kona]|uniref:Acyl-CoA synthetase family member n=1 Tax=Acrasis kona TaxID=1008807 RepID=A0AAW2ZMX7_9EUKA